jgi:hypothetical protein
MKKGNSLSMPHMITLLEGDEFAHAFAVSSLFGRFFGPSRYAPGQDLRNYCGLIDKTDIEVRTVRRKMHMHAEGMKLFEV